MNGIANATGSNAAIPASLASAGPGDLVETIVDLLRPFAGAPSDLSGVVAAMVGPLMDAVPGLRAALEQALTPVERGQFEAAMDRAAPAAPAASYTVRAGDTLADIAARFGTSWQTLAAANGLADPDRIMPGQQLAIPAGDNGRYTVRAGDTLSGIADMVGTSWQTLARANGLADPDVILPGQQLVIPAGSGARPPAEAPAPSPVAPAPAGTDRANGLSGAGLDALYRREAMAGVSNRLHWPEGASGVTLGPGYDLRYRSETEVVRDLTAIGVDPATAARVADGAGLSGLAARDFAGANRDLVNLSPAQERQLMERTVLPYSNAVREAVTVPLTQNQYDALVSFAYNIGIDGFRESTALRRLNGGDLAGATEAMAWWNKSDGVVVQGLVNRRADEIRQFHTPGPAFAPAAPEAPPQAAPPAAPSRPQSAADVAALVMERGDDAARADLQAGQRVVVAVRADTDVRANPNGQYDDRMMVVWQEGGQYRMAEFRGNTEPSGQYRHDGARGDRGYGIDMNGDGRPDLGRLIEGSYRYTQESGNFLGNTYFRPDRTTPVERDSNGDGRFDGSDPNRIDQSGGGRSFLIHTGGASNSWSAGCQTMPPQEYAAFLDALGGQRSFSYVLVNES